MSNATVDSPPAESSSPDPSMTRLAPTRSRARNRILVAAGFATLVAAWFSPNLLQPSIDETNGAHAGSWSALPSHHQVLTMTSLNSQTWPRVGVRSVVAVPGAEVAGAWIAAESVIADGHDDVDDADFDTGRDYLEAAIPALDFRADQLPRNVERGDTALLIVLWDIVSCDTLDSSSPPPAAVRLRTVVGTRGQADLPDIANPAFDLATLRESGTCP